MKPPYVGGPAGGPGGQAGIARCHNYRVSRGLVKGFGRNELWNTNLAKRHEERKRGSPPRTKASGDPLFVPPANRFRDACAAVGAGNAEVLDAALLARATSSTLSSAGSLSSVLARSRSNTCHTRRSGYW